MATQHTIRKPRPSSEVTRSYLSSALAGMEAKITEATDASRPWDEYLAEPDKDFVHRLARVLSWALVDEDVVAIGFVDTNALEETLRGRVVHRHECGSRLTGPAVKVESA